MVRIRWLSPPPPGKSLVAVLPIPFGEIIQVSASEFGSKAWTGCSSPPPPPEEDCDPTIPMCASPLRHRT